MHIPKTHYRTIGKSTPPPRCIFCGYSGKLTGEHFISQRYHKYIPRTSRSYRVLHSVEFPDHSEFATGKRNADPRDWKIRCVCEATCNNGWMRKLDDQAEPILTPLITGQSVRLTPPQLEVLATWAVMKTIVLEYDEPNDASVHHSHRKSLFKNKLPPYEGWSVWIGHYPRAIWQPITRLRPFLWLRPEVSAKRKHPRATYYNGAIATQIFGELFIQVVHGPKAM